MSGDWLRPPGCHHCYKCATAGFLVDTGCYAAPRPDTYADNSIGNFPSATAENNIPVVIAYGEGVETHVQITRGIMQPVGIPPSQPVTVTLFLTNAIPGTPVKVGLYDGGQIAAAIAVPSPPPIGAAPLDNTTPIITVAADQTVRFNFQARGTLRLYRVLLTVGPRQYLMQFFAVRPRVIPSPTPVVAPSPPIVVPP